MQTGPQKTTRRFPQPRLIIPVIILLAASLHGNAAERNKLQSAATESQIRSSVVCGRTWVPYPSYTDRKGWDGMTGSNRQELIRRGEAYLEYDWKTIRATDYLAFERSGDRTVMESRYFSNTDALSALLVAELSEGKGRFMDQIVNGVFHLCGMTSWAVSAHQNLQQSGRALPDRNDPVIALFSSGTAAILAWTCHFLSDELDSIDPIITARIRQEIEERILTPYMNEDRFWWMAFRPVWAVNNWNPWCNSNVLQCFLLLEDDPDRLSAAICRSMRSVDQFLNYIKEDGACEEGPAYWELAAGKLFDYLQLLSWGTGGKVDIFSSQIIRDMGEYITRSYIGNGWVVNFADATARYSGEAGLVYRYGKAIGSEEMMHFAAYLDDLNGHAVPYTKETHLLRHLENIRHAEELSGTVPMISDRRFTWYPETQFCYMRQGRLFLAAKGGHNSESHNHNDIGSFILCIDNSPVLVDAGVVTYTRQTFSTDRYSIWSMQSTYHNLPDINGFAQHDGKSFTASDVRADSHRCTFSCDIAKAYPAEAGIRTWRRSYRLAQDRLMMSDDFSIDSPSVPNILNFLVWGEADTTEAGRIRLTTPDGKKAVIKYDWTVLAPSVETIPLDDPRLTEIWGSSLTRLSLQAHRTMDKGSWRINITAD